MGHVYHVLHEGLAYFGVDDSHQSSTPSGTFNNIPNRGGPAYRRHASDEPEQPDHRATTTTTRAAIRREGAMSSTRSWSGAPSSLRTSTHRARWRPQGAITASTSLGWAPRRDSTEALAFTDAISSTDQLFLPQRDYGHDSAPRQHDLRRSDRAASLSLAGNRRRWWWRGGTGMTAWLNALRLVRSSGQERPDGQLSEGDRRRRT